MAPNLRKIIPTVTLSIPVYKFRHYCTSGALLQVNRLVVGTLSTDDVRTSGYSKHQNYADFGPPSFHLHECRAVAKMIRAAGNIEATGLTRG